MHVIWGTLLSYVLVLTNLKWSVNVHGNPSFITLAWTCCIVVLNVLNPGQTLWRSPDACHPVKSHLFVLVRSAFTRDFFIPLAKERYEGLALFCSNREGKSLSHALKSAKKIPKIVGYNSSQELKWLKILCRWLKILCSWVKSRQGWGVTCPRTVIKWLRNTWALPFYYISLVNFTVVIATMSYACSKTIISFSMHFPQCHYFPMLCAHEKKFNSSRWFGTWEFFSRFSQNTQTNYWPTLKDWPSSNTLDKFY